MGMSSLLRQFNGKPLTTPQSTVLGQASADRPPTVVSYVKCDQIGGTFSNRVLLTCHA